MVFVVLRILAFMIRRMGGYALAGLGGRKRRKAYLELAYLRWADFVLEAFGVQLAVKGREHYLAAIGANPSGLPAKTTGAPAVSRRPVVVLANHQSQLDIPVLAGGLRTMMGFVAKRELGRIPVLAYWMRETGCIFIDRSNKSEAQRSLNELAQSMGEHPVVVFPEGTRSKSGELLPFKPGGARLAMLSKALIIPARIEATREACEARRGRKGPFQVSVTYFPALDAATLLPDRAGADQVKRYVEACWRGETVPNLHAAAS